MTSGTATGSISAATGEEAIRDVDELYAVENHLISASPASQPWSASPSTETFDGRPTLRTTSTGTVSDCRDTTVAVRNIRAANSDGDEIRQFQPLAGDDAELIETGAEFSATAITNPGTVSGKLPAAFCKTGTAITGIGLFGDAVNTCGSGRTVEEESEESDSSMVDAGNELSRNLPLS